MPVQEAIQHAGACRHQLHRSSFPQSRRVTRALSQPAAAAARPQAPERTFEQDLDFKARLSWVVEVACWLLPPLLLFGLPMMMGQTQDSVAAAGSAVRQAVGAGPKPWLRWLGRVALWVGKALASTFASVVLRYLLMQRQVRRWQPSSCMCRAILQAQRRQRPPAPRYAVRECQL